MDLYEAIKNRRSHRFYKPDPVPREVLERIVAAALWAPSGTNQQPWDLTILTGRPRDEFVAIASQSINELEPRLRQLFDEARVALVSQFFKNLGGAPVVIAVTVWRETDPFGQEAHIQSGAALMQNLLLAAEAEGLGTCWMTGIKSREKELLAYLGLPDRHLLAITPVGYSAKTPPVVPRKERPVRWLGFD
ncbi:MAG: nitroreductase family protein [Desulfobacca sp.]|uniref:nitroreductase family protein n=1 Tax=Desulfobacca sp. TaxID=2067990 RepID=UPI00404B7695